MCWLRIWEYSGSSNEKRFNKHNQVSTWNKVHLYKSTEIRWLIIVFPCFPNKIDIFHFQRHPRLMVKQVTRDHWETLRISTVFLVGMITFFVTIVFSCRISPSNHHISGLISPIILYDLCVCIIVALKHHLLIIKNSVWSPPATSPTLHTYNILQPWRFLPKQINNLGQSPVNCYISH